ncbi:hypothetical protein ACJIZ3_008747 [Penstemon smallii]|uniref:Uncharacterized protein n=1 Tax=Penstemon smallii TaxID=265156 RepID=A0ABD3TBM3_9LAMI
MPLTRSQRADYTDQFGGWSPHERAYFIGRLFASAHHTDIRDVATHRWSMQRIATQMNANFQPRRFTMARLRDMLHHIRLEYVYFYEFLENPWVDYDPYNMEVMVLAPYWETVDPLVSTYFYRRFMMHGEPHYMKLRFIFGIKRCAILPPEVVGSPQWPIHVRADDEDALAIIPFNLGRGNVPEATPPHPVRENDVVVNGNGGNVGGGEENMNRLFGSGLWNVD